MKKTTIRLLCGVLLCMLGNSAIAQTVSVVGLGASHDVITRANTDSVFSIGVIFDQPMNMDVTPEVTFTEALDSLLSPPFAEWLSETEFALHFQVLASGSVVPDIGVIVASAEPMDRQLVFEGYEQPAVFSIITAPLMVADSYASQYELTMDDSGRMDITFTVMFNQPIDVSSQHLPPSLSFVQTEASDILLWNDMEEYDERTLNFIFEVNAWETNVPQVDVVLENVYPLFNNPPIESTTLRDAFSIMMAGVGGPPQVEYVSMGGTELIDPTMIGDTLVVVVGYIQQMETTSSPALSFPGMDTTILQALDGEWINEYTYAAYYVLGDFTVADHTPVDVNVEGAYNPSEQLQYPYLQQGVFALLPAQQQGIAVTDISTTAPVVTNDHFYTQFDIDIYFSEQADSAFKPVVILTPENATLMPSGGFWLSTNSYRAQYYVMESAENLTVDLTVSGAQALNGLQMQPQSFKSAFSIETQMISGAQVAYIEMDGPTEIAPSMAGDLVSFYIGYSTEMDTMSKAMLQFPGVDSLTLTFIGGYWPDQYNCKLTYQINNFSLTSNQVVGANVYSPNALNGGQTEVYSQAELFVLLAGETPELPYILDYSGSSSEITDNYAGSPFMLNFMFNTPMESSIIPSVNLYPHPNALNPISVKWLSDVQLQAAYEVFDYNEDFWVSANVTGAQSTAGTYMEPQNINDFFYINMDNSVMAPGITNAYVSPSFTIDQSSIDQMFSITVEFDQSMNTESVPGIDFYPMSAHDVLDLADYEWQNDYTFVAYYTIMESHTFAESVGITVHDAYNNSGMYLDEHKNQYDDLFAIDLGGGSDQIAGPDQEVCESYAWLNGDEPENGDYTLAWTSLTPDVLVEMPSISSTRVSNLQPGENIFTYTVTLDDTDMYMDTVIVLNNEPIMPDVWADTTVVTEPMATLTVSAMPAGQMGEWDVPNFTTAKIEAQSQGMVKATMLNPGHNIFEYEVTKGVCESSVMVLVKYDDGICDLAIDATIQDPTAFGATDGSVTLSVSGGTAPYSYNWKEGSGNRPTAEGLGAGSQGVAVIDATGCVAVQELELNAPACTYDAAFIPVVEKNRVTFAANKPTVKAQMVWEFGDGDFAEDINNYEYPYSAVGTYEATLTVTYIDADPAQGCQFSSTMPVAITQMGSCNIIGVIGHLEPLGCGQYQLDAYSMHPQGDGYLTQHWDMGDGATYDNDNRVFHTYTQGGAYPVSFTVTDLMDSSCSVTHQITLDHAPIQASIDYTQRESTAVEFGINATGGTGAYYAYYDFGDGNASEANDQGQAYNFYSEPGTYPVCVSVSEKYVGYNAKEGDNVNYECPLYTCDTIVVEPSDCNAYGDFYLDYNYDPATERALCSDIALSVSWTYNNDINGDPVPYTIGWDFGDGTTLELPGSDTVPNTNHSYAEPGNYRVRMTVMSGADASCKYETSESVTIKNVPASFTYEQLNSEVKFELTYETGPDNRYYGAIDPGFVFDSTPVKSLANHAEYYNYPEAGQYPACIIVDDEHQGCVTSVNCQDININPFDCNGYVDFGYEVGQDSSGNNLVYFFNYTEQDPTNPMDYTWSISDGSEFYGEQPDPYTFEADGWYEVCLSGYSDKGCFYENCMDLKVGDVSCYASFDYEPVPGTNSIMVYNNSEYKPETAQLYWDFDDGEQLYTDSVGMYTFAEPGVYTICLSVWDETTDCYDDVCKEVSIGEVACHAKFSTSTEPGLLRASFYNESMGNADISYWDFGDGRYSYQEYPEHTYNYPGTYEVSLTIVNSATGCQDYYVQMVQVGETGCQAKFSFLVDPSTNTVSLTNQSTKTGADSYVYWDLGDGNIAFDAKTLSHAYQPGVYTVCLLVSNELGCYDEICKDIIIKGSPDQAYCKADFTYVINENDQVSFYDRSVGNVSETFWYFGEEDFAIATDPVHEFAYQGFHDVCLYTFDTLSGCESEICKTLELGASEDQGCQADFYYKFDDTKENVSFTANIQGQAEGYYWYVSDGSYSEQESFTKSFARAGTYEVCLYIYNETTGCWDETCKNINIEKQGQERVYCEAKFIHKMDSVTGNVSFANRSQGKINEYYWDFGDYNFGDSGQGANDPSVQENPTWQYQLSGLYTVCLYGYYLNDTTGQECFSESCKDINVKIAGEQPSTTYCNAAFNYAVKDGGSVSFRNTSQGSVGEWYWYFDDGEYSLDQHPSHTYTQSGVYYVSLFTYDEATDCFAETTKQVTIEMGDDKVFCEAKFSYFVDPATSSVSFNDASIGNASEWYWYFDDGDFSNEQSPVHTYTKPGSYLVCLNTFDQATGCYAETCKEVIIKGTGLDYCKAEFSYFVQGDSVLFTDQTKGKEQDIERFWDFGDDVYNESEITKRKPMHRYAESGYYWVCMFTHNIATGCFDEVCKEIQVKVNDTDVVCNADFKFFVDLTGEKKGVSCIAETKGSITDYYWTIGNGAYFEGASIDYEYQKWGTYDVCLYTSNSENDCYSQVCKEIKVGTGDCDAKFSYFVDVETNILSLKDESLGDVAEYYWTFGDRSTSTRANPKHTYAAAGYYPVALAIRTANGCASYVEDWIPVGNADCVAKFDYRVEGAIGAQQISFINKSKGAYDQVFWDFGDGEYSEEAAPMHTYQSAGMFGVGLTVASFDTNDNLLCMDYTYREVQVGKVDCSAKFSYFVDSANQAVTFVNEAIGDATELIWEFGDGGYSQNPNPVYGYDYPGYYWVSLATYNEATNCMDYYEDLILVSAEDIDVEAAFKFTVKGNKVNFSNKSAGDGLSYEWSMGDRNGTLLTTENPSFTYAKAGFYQVCLNVSKTVDRNGTQVVMENSYCDVIEIAPQAGEAKVCAANFIYTVDSVSKTLTLVDRTPQAVTEWTWTIGNQTVGFDTVMGTDAAQYAKYVKTFADTGFYLVGLKVKATGCDTTEIATKMVNVGAGKGLRGDFVTVPVEADAVKGVTVRFKGASYGRPASRSWDFGDSKGTDNTTWSPWHTYAEHGNYNVCLTITDAVTQQAQTTCNLVNTQTLFGIEGEVGTGFEFGDMQQQLSVNPNPANAKSYISYTVPQGGTVELVLIDEAGKEAGRAALQPANMGHFNAQWPFAVMPGAYTLKMTTATGESTTKVIVVE